MILVRHRLRAPRLCGRTLRKIPLRLHRWVMHILRASGVLWLGCLLRPAVLSCQEDADAECGEQQGDADTDTDSHSNLGVSGKAGG